MTALRWKRWDFLALGVGALSHTPCSKECEVLHLGLLLMFCKLPVLPYVLLSALLLVSFSEDLVCLLGKLTIFCGLLTPGSCRLRYP